MTAAKLLALTLACTVLAGCGTTRPGMAPLASARHAAGLRHASKAVVEAFPHKFGWNNPAATPVVNDIKARGLKALELGFGVKEADTPRVVDLRGKMSPVGDQGMFGSCTSFAMVKGIGEFMELKQIASKGGDPSKDFVPLSPRFLWFDERSFMGNEKIDTGATMFLGMNDLVSDGACAEASYPYCPEQLQQNELYRNYFLQDAPPKAAVAEAKAHRGGALRQLTKLSEIKASLDEGYPAVFGFVVFSSIRAAGKGGMLPVPTLQEDEVLGGHATVAVGYDDAKQCLILRNSWGGEWGDKGYFYMPYDYFNTQFGLVADAWTLREAN